MWLAEKKISVIHDQGCRHDLPISTPLSAASRPGLLVRVLVTGASGQLGGALLRAAPRHTDLNAIDADDVDFTDLGMLRARLVVEAPEVIINAAAYTDPDTAESEEDVAREINADAVAVLVEVMKDTGGRLVHVSCDSVFSGEGRHVYRPGDTPNPLSAYGRTKAQGEAHLRPKDLLIRTSWLYEAGGKNYVRALIAQIKAGREIVAATDEIGSPTWATGLARTIWTLVERQACGIFHHTDAGIINRYEFACGIAEEALALALVDRIPTITPISGNNLRTSGHSARFSPLDCGATRTFLRDEAPDWRSNLRLMLQAEMRRG